MAIILTVLLFFIIIWLVRFTIWWCNKELKLSIKEETTKCFAEWMRESRLTHLEYIDGKFKDLEKYIEDNI